MRLQYTRRCNMQNLLDWATNYIIHTWKWKELSDLSLAAEFAGQHLPICHWAHPIHFPSFTLHSSFPIPFPIPHCFDKSTQTLTARQEVTIGFDVHNGCHSVHPYISITGDVAVMVIHSQISLKPIVLEWPLTRSSFLLKCTRVQGYPFTLTSNMSGICRKRTINIKAEPRGKKMFPWIG